MNKLKVGYRWIVLFQRFRAIGQSKVKGQRSKVKERRAALSHNQLKMKNEKLARRSSEGVIGLKVD